MADLASCYFCGTIDEPVEEYPVIPHEMEPPDELQRTVIVCSNCRERLRRVVKPLITFLDETDRADRDDVESAGSSPSTDRSGTRSPSEPDEDDTETEPGSEQRGDRRRGARRPRQERSEDGNVATDDADDDNDERGDEEIPSGYDEVLRLIQNREFPVNRDEFEEVAMSAYGLEWEECQEAIETAVSRGVLVDDGDQLKRPGED